MLRKTCLLLFHPAVCRAVNTASANVTSLLITLLVLAPDDPANSNKSLYTCTYRSVHKLKN